jgi:2-polyprenyl-6-methoxyphenol hydroxylase-like FAD-dependent oxidoreductase
MPAEPTKVIVLGAGIGGLALAAALKHCGIAAEVHERSASLRAEGSGLGMISNAIAALATLGIDLDLARRGEVITSFDIKDAQGDPIVRLPMPELGRELGFPSVCIGRNALHESLLEAASGVPVMLGSHAVRVESDEDGATVHFADGSTARGDVVVGADGFNSVVRRQFTGAGELVLEPGYVCWLAITAFSHPALPQGAVAHYWGSGQRFGLLDIGGGDVYWWGTKNMSVAEARDWRGTREDLLALYDGWAGEVTAAIGATAIENVIAVPARDRLFLEKWGEDRVTLLGDAAHPMLTSLGQGAGMAIEDAVVLATTLARTDDPVDALRSYEDQRRDRTRMVVAASRALSEGEQLEDPVLRKQRDDQLRGTSFDELVDNQRELLTFPGVDV